MHRNYHIDNIRLCCSDWCGYNHRGSVAFIRCTYGLCIFSGNCDTLRFGVNGEPVCDSKIDCMPKNGTFIPAKFTKKMSVICVPKNKKASICVVVTVASFFFVCFVIEFIMILSFGSSNNPYDYNVQNNCTVINELNCFMGTHVCDFGGVKSDITSSCVNGKLTRCSYTTLLHKSKYFDGTRENSTRIVGPVTKMSVYPEVCYLSAESKGLDVMFEYVDYSGMFYSVAMVVCVFTGVSMFLCCVYLSYYIYHSKKRETYDNIN